MKNKRRKSETSDNESEKNGGTRVAIDNDESDDAHVTRKSASKRRSSRGAPIQKPATENVEADDADIKNDSDTESSSISEKEAEKKRKRAEKEQTNGEKIIGQKPSSNKRRKKEDQKASTSARDKSPDDEYEVPSIMLN